MKLSLLFGCIVCLANFAFAGNLYLVTNYDIPAIGKIFAGAKVSELKKEGNETLVKYTGYIPAGSTVAYARFGLMEKELALMDGIKYQKVQEQEDDYGTRWAQISLEMKIPNAMLIDDEKKINVKGKELFEARCGTCHPLHNYDEFTINVWPGIVDTMKKNSGLNDDEYSLLVRFLQTQAPKE